MKQLQKQQPQRQHSLWIIFGITLLLLIAGTIFLAINSWHSLPALISAVIGALGTILSLVGLVYTIVTSKSSNPVPAPSPAPQPQPINVTVNNVLPGVQSPQPPAIPATPNASISPVADPPRPAADPLTLRAQPLPIGEQHIQQRTAVVKEVYDMLIAPDTAAVALCAIGGIGKSTLAALVLDHAERERRAGRGPFHAEAILLRINENTTFLELATNIFAATGKSMPDFSQLLPPNQAFSVFNALNTADPPRLIVLD